MRRTVRIRKEKIFCVTWVTIAVTRHTVRIEWVDILQLQDITPHTVRTEIHRNCRRKIDLKLKWHCNSVKWRVKLSPYMSWRYMGSEGRAPLILTVGYMAYVVSFQPEPLYCRWKNPGIHWKRCPVDHSTALDAFEKRKISFTDDRQTDNTIPRASHL